MFFCQCCCRGFLRRLWQILSLQYCYKALGTTNHHKYFRRKAGFFSSCDALNVHLASTIARRDFCEDGRQLFSRNAEGNLGSTCEGDVKYFNTIRISSVSFLEVQRDRPCSSFQSKCNFSSLSSSIFANSFRKVPKINHIRSYSMRLCRDFRFVTKSFEYL